ncbi:MAG: hypothetical protein KAT31_18240 [Bacteroidales bacterium]|nr:hypothetical protein [Bacteroidales bacterium]
MKNPLERFKKEITPAVVERGERQLKRIMTVIDVLYALMIFQVFLIMPRPEVDNFTANELVSVFRESYLNYLVMTVGMILILLYWGQNHLIFGNLNRSDATLSVIAILQAFFVLLYLYFIRLDMQMGGQTLILQMESLSLAIAGGMGVWAWHYANKRKLISDSVSELERGKTYLKLMPEPITSVLTFPFAVFGPNIWTASWLLMIPVSYILKVIRKRMKERKA